MTFDFHLVPWALVAAAAAVTKMAGTVPAVVSPNLRLTLQSFSLRGRPSQATLLVFPVM